MNRSSRGFPLALIAIGLVPLACDVEQPDSTDTMGTIGFEAIVAHPTQLPAGVPADFVATPVGYFHPSCLIHVGADASTSRQAPPCQYPHYDSQGRPASSSLTTPAEVPAAGSDLEGWSLADFSTYMAGVSRLSASWVVPPTPAQAGQTLFYFPGTQSLDGKPGGTIVQPVLAYENAQWFVQSWNCCEGGSNAEFGDSVTVKPGDLIEGTNVGSTCDASTGICDTWQITTRDARTGQASVFDSPSFGHPHQWIFSAVYETYSLTSCNQLPSTGELQFENFAIDDISGHPISVPSLSWTDQVDQSLTGCGSFWGGSQSGTNFTINYGDPRGNFRIVAPLSSKCLDITGQGTANGTNVEEWACNGTGAQTFHVKSTDGTNFQIVNNHSNKCVDVSGSGTTNGTKIQLWACNGGTAQNFHMVQLSGGDVNFVNPHSGKCLDIAHSGTANGTHVQLWDCNGTRAQIWQLQSL